MGKVALIAWHEFKKSVFRRRFLIVLLIPVLIGLGTSIVGFVTVSALGRFEAGKIGYLDPTHLLDKARNAPDEAFVFTPFASEDSARAALARGEIKGIIRPASDFASSGNVDLVYWRDKPDKDVGAAFGRFRDSALLSGQPDAIKNRITSDVSFTYQTPDQARSKNDTDLPAFIVPLVLTVLFIIALFGGAQYLMQAVLDEKENRMMEIVVTSVTPTQLMAGKVTGLGAVGMLQMLIWLVVVAIVLAVLGSRVPVLQTVSLKPDVVALALVLFGLQYVTLGACMAAIGSMVTDAKQGQNYASPFTLIAMSPLWFSAVILFDPNGVLAVILSLFPLTAPVTLILRYGMVSVPVWQIAVALTLQVLAAAGAIWLAGRIFHVGMLRFDKGVKWRELAESIRF